MPRPSRIAELLAVRLHVSTDELPGKLRELKGAEGLRPLAQRVKQQTGVHVGHDWLSRYLSSHP